MNDEVLNKVVLSNVVLRCLVGSTAHGLHLEGKDDRDEMAVFVPPLEHVVGHDVVEHAILRTAEDRVREAGKSTTRGWTPPSQAGDLDLVCYSARKFLMLAGEGNPTVLILLWARPLFAGDAGRLIQDEAPLFASKQAGRRFLGYLQAQEDRFSGVRGQMRTTRADLIEAHGYDTKYAMHAARLGFQGVELMETGRLSLPMTGPPRDACMEIRRGELSKEGVVALIDDVKERLVEAIKEAPFPEEPFWKAIDRLSARVHREHWFGSTAPSLEVT